MDTLDSLRDGGRVVGVVSHVAELRDRIPTQLRGRARRATAPDCVASDVDRFARHEFRTGRSTRRSLRAALPPPRRRGPRPGRGARRHATPTSASSATATSTSASATACSRAPATPRTSASRSGSIHGGAWGFASGVVLTDRGGRAVAETAVAVAQVAAAMTSAPGRAGARAGPRRRHLGLVVRRQPVRGRHGREGRPARRLDRPAAHRRRRSTTRPPTSSRSRRTSTTPTWPAPAPPSSGSGSSPGSRRTAPTTRPASSTRWRSIAPPVGRGWEYLTGGAYWDWDAELDRGARAAGREAQGAERRGRAATTWSSTPPTCG